MRSWLTSILLLFVASGVFAAEPPQARDVDVTAMDGVKLRATYYAAAAPGPAVMLLHMCNTTRKSWEPLARKLSAAGIHALAMDYRGYGESGGERFEDDAAKRQQVVAEKWPGDVDAAYAYLLQQPGVDKKRVGAAGGSCGVNQAIQLARRHAEIKSLALLAGGTGRDGTQFLHRTTWMPVFASAAADDQFDADAPRSMEWLAALSGNPRNKFVGFKDGGHGTEIFGKHPELPTQMSAWFTDTLVKAPAGPGTASPRKSQISEFWALVDQPGKIRDAVQMFHTVRKRDPAAYLFPEGIMNQLAYERMQAGQTKEAIELFKLNVEAYPDSANAYDSLGDGYVADGQNDLALSATQKSLELLPASKVSDEFKNAIRESAEQKLQKLKGGSAR